MPRVTNGEETVRLTEVSAFSSVWRNRSLTGMCTCICTSLLALAARTVCTDAWHSHAESATRSLAAELLERRLDVPASRLQDTSGRE
eukprot:5785137-Amphidinium_carterae.1